MPAIYTPTVGGERHCESKVSCLLRTQHNDPRPQGSNLDHLIQSSSMLKLRLRWFSSNINLVQILHVITLRIVMQEHIRPLYNEFISLKEKKQTKKDHKIVTRLNFQGTQ